MQLLSVIVSADLVKYICLKVGAGYWDDKAVGDGALDRANSAVRRADEFRKRWSQNELVPLARVPDYSLAY